MVGEDATGPLGVIIIEQAGLEPLTGASLGYGGIDGDATLAQTLTRLAALGPASCTEPSAAAFSTGPSGHPCLRRNQFTGRLAPFWATRASVSANLVGLAAELEQAVGQVLRRIAAGR